MKHGVAGCLDALIEIGRDSRMAAEERDAADLSPGVLFLLVYRADEVDHVGGEVSEPCHAAKLCVWHTCGGEALWHREREACCRLYPGRAVW